MNLATLGESSAALLLAVAMCVGDFGCATRPGLPSSERHEFTPASYGTIGADYQANTTAFQRAIDACAAAGGGVVRVPPGEYVLGRIFLKDNVTLHLEGGAVLRPTTETAAFPPLTGDPESNFRPEDGEGCMRRRYSLVYAFRAKNIAVEGRGKILGDGKAFWVVKNTGDFPKWKTWAPAYYYKARAVRPFLVLLEQCENVLLRDITLEDAPVYGVWFAGCRHARCQNVTVCNDLAGPNTDGFHFSSCRDVHITDCHFTCGDDCIAIDGNYKGASGNFTITGCIFKTTVNCFRIFTGLDAGRPDRPARGRVSDVSASNCSVEDASGVFNVIADRGDIERLVFSNFSINMDQRGTAFFLLTRRGGAIQNLLLRNMAIRTDGLGVISGEDGGTIRDVMLDGVSYDVYPRTKLYGNGFPDPVPNYGQAHNAPYNLFLRHAKNLRLQNLHVNWRDADLADLHHVPNGKDHWPCIQARNIEGLDIRGVVCSPFGRGEPAILLENVANATLADCRAQPGTQTFLRLAGACKNIRLIHNDLSQAVKSHDALPSLHSEIHEHSNTLRP